MDLLRVGDKVISKNKIQQKVDKILDLRCQGCSQQETAVQMGIDRSFVSRLESLGEIRKGQNVAVIGFPIKNKDEIMEVFSEYGIQSCLLMTEKERREFVEKRSGADLANEIMKMAVEYRSFDTVVILASDKRVRMLEALLSQQVITIDIGSSPITEDVHVDVEQVRTLLKVLIG